MIYLLAVLLITICSLLHDGNYTSKGVAVGVHAIGATLLLHNYGLWGCVVAAVNVAVFWGVFRRGWQAKAELSAINGSGTLDDIVKAYPPYLGYVPKFITICILKLPFPLYYRRIQSGLIALLWTGHISSLPILILGAL